MCVRRALAPQRHGPEALSLLQLRVNWMKLEKSEHGIETLGASCSAIFLSLSTSPKMRFPKFRR